jgi:hypothetical protein
MEGTVDPDLVPVLDRNNKPQTHILQLLQCYLQSENYKLITGIGNFASLRIRPFERKKNRFRTNCYLFGYRYFIVKYSKKIYLLCFVEVLKFPKPPVSSKSICTNFNVHI